ncbi:MAG: hypothetical protein QXH24_01765 [Candidatus Bathyarchaeia archaeon]
MSGARSKVLKLAFYDNTLIRISNILRNRAPEYEVIPVYEEALGHMDVLSTFPKKPINLLGKLGVIFHGVIILLPPRKGKSVNATLFSCDELLRMMTA